MIKQPKRRSPNTQKIWRKNIGGIMIGHRPNQSDAALGVSSANTNLSNAMSSRKPKKPQARRSQSHQSSITLNASNASSVAASSVTSSTASPSTSTSKSKRNRKAPYYFGFESSVCSVSDDSAPMPKRHKSTNPVIETVIQEEALQTPAPDTSFELPVVSPLAPLPIGTWSPEAYDYDDYAREISMSVFDAEN